MKKFGIILALMMSPTVAHGYEDELRQLERTEPSTYTLQVIESIQAIVPDSERERFDELVRKHRDRVLEQKLFISKR